MTPAPKSSGHKVGRIVCDKTHTPLLTLTVVLCLLMSSETWVGAELPRSEHEQVDSLHAVEGRVTKVDTVAGAIRVAWEPFGVFTKTLEVESATRIRVVGRPATLHDIRETATVRVGYRVDRGRSVATSIDMVLAPNVSARRAS